MAKPGKHPSPLQAVAWRASPARRRAKRPSRWAALLAKRPSSPLLVLAASRWCSCRNGAVVLGQAGRGGTGEERHQRRDQPRKLHLRVVDRQPRPGRRHQRGEDHGRIARARSHRSDRGVRATASRAEEPNVLVLDRGRLGGRRPNPHVRFVLAGRQQRAHRRRRRLLQRWRAKLPRLRRRRQRPRLQRHAGDRAQPGFVARAPERPTT